MLSINYPSHADLFTLRLLAFLLRRHQDNPNAVREALHNPLIVKRGGQERESMFELRLNDETLSLGSLSSREGKSKADVTVYWPDHGSPPPSLRIQSVATTIAQKGGPNVLLCRDETMARGSQTLFRTKRLTEPQDLKDRLRQ